jgi:hypothetical protein
MSGAAACAERLTPSSAAARGKRSLQRRLPAGLAQHPAADRHDQAGLLGERDELERRHEPALGVVPAHERLDAGDPAVVELDDRLVVELELAVLERALQVGLELEPRERASSCIAGSKTR